MSKRHIVWMEAPLGAPDAAGITANLERAERWFKWLMNTFQNVDFAADWILWCRALNDLNPAHRERGLAFDDEMIRRSDAAWYVGGRVSSGMARGMSVARKTGRRVVDFTALGAEPPAAFDAQLPAIISGLQEGGYRHRHVDAVKGTIHLFGTPSAHGAYVRALGV